MSYLTDFSINLAASIFYAMIVYFIFLFERLKKRRYEISDISRRIGYLEIQYQRFYYCRGTFGACCDTVLRLSPDLSKNEKIFNLKQYREWLFELRRCVLNIEYLNKFQTDINNELGRFENALPSLQESHAICLRHFLSEVSRSSLLLDSFVMMANRNLKIIDNLCFYLGIDLNNQNAIDIPSENIKITIAKDAQRSTRYYLFNSLISIFEETYMFLHVFAQWINNHKQLYTPLISISDSLPIEKCIGQISDLKFDWAELNIKNITSVELDSPPNLVFNALDTE
jgi:hypothetical protein